MHCLALASVNSSMHVAARHTNDVADQTSVLSRDMKITLAVTFCVNGGLFDGIEDTYGYHGFVSITTSLFIQFANERIEQTRQHLWRSQPYAMNDA